MVSPTAVIVKEPFGGGDDVEVGVDPLLAPLVEVFGVLEPVCVEPVDDADAPPDPQPAST